MLISDWSSDVCSSDLFWQPVRIGQQPFGLAGHVALLQMVDQTCRLVVLGFGDRHQDARLGDPAEIILDRRLPARRDHIETDRTRQHMAVRDPPLDAMRSEEHTSELQSLMRISYAVFCLKKNTKKKEQRNE